MDDDNDSQKRSLRKRKPTKLRSLPTRMAVQKARERQINEEKEAKVQAQQQKITKLSHLEYADHVVRVMRHQAPELLITDLVLDSSSNAKNEFTFTLTNHGVDRTEEVQKKLQATIDEWNKEVTKMPHPEPKLEIENVVDFELLPSITYIKDPKEGPGAAGRFNHPERKNFLASCECSKTSNCFENKEKCCPDIFLGDDNGRNFPYNQNGMLAIDYRHPIIECNENCTCGPDCPNRVVQKGRKIPLQIFRTSNRGWGVRTLARIKKGSFVVECVGEVEIIKF